MPHEKTRKMKTYIKSLFRVLLIVLLLVTAGQLWVSCGSGGNDSSFRRAGQEHFIRDSEHFRVDQRLRRIYFKKGKKEIRLDDIPTINGSYFYLRGKKLVKLSPGLSGKTGVYTYLYMESLTKEGNIDFRMEVHRENKEADSPVERITSSKISQPLFKNVTLEKNDRLLLKFEGRGIVYFSQPIYYKPRQPDEKKKGKYILFIAVDTFRGDQVGKRINGQPLTPNIDRFLKDSVYLENTYAQTSWTLPSFMSLFTGLNEYNHEVGIKESLKPEKPFLMEPLSREFITFGFHGGKVMNGRWGFSRGFDYYKKYQPAGALYPNGGQSLFGKAVEVLEQSDFADLFMFLHTYQTHAPYTPPMEFLLRLDKAPKYKSLDAVNFSEPQKTYVPVEEEYKNSLKLLYQAEVLAFDAYFGRFIDKLEKMGLYDDAMIVLMSDHGEEFFEHLGWGHSHSLYNELLKVPVAIKFPGSRFKNKRITWPTAVTDLLPTILSFYRIPFEAAELDGKDLMPLIREQETGTAKNTGRRNYVVSTISIGRYFEALPPRIALFFDEYKLIYNEPFTKKDLAYFNGFTPPPQPPVIELYHLKEDPAETRNIAAAHPGLTKKMMPLLLRIRKIIRRKEALLGTKKKALDKEVQEQLKSLGYL
jgi:arylsulfatase A-like enzyme